MLINKGVSLPLTAAHVDIRHVYDTRTTHSVRESITNAFVSDLFPEIVDETSHAKNVPWSRVDKCISKAIHTKQLRSLVTQHDIWRQKRTPALTAWSDCSSNLMTHTSFLGGKLAVTENKIHRNRKDCDLFRQLMAVDISDGVIVCWNELADPSRMKPFFDFDIILEDASQRLNLRGIRHSWEWVLKVTQQCMELFFSPQSCQCVLSLTPEVAYKETKVKSACHIVCPGLICERRNMSVIVPKLVQMLHDGDNSIDWLQAIDQNVYQSTPSLRMNGNFKAKPCDKCHKQAHSYGEVMCCLPGTKGGIIPQLFSNGPTDIPNTVARCDRYQSIPSLKIFAPWWPYTSKSLSV